MGHTVFKACPKSYTACRCNCGRQWVHAAPMVKAPHISDCLHSSPTTGLSKAPTDLATGQPVLVARNPHLQAGCQLTAFHGIQGSRCFPCNSILLQTMQWHASNSLPQPCNSTKSACYSLFLAGLQSLLLCTELICSYLYADASRCAPTTGFPCLHPILQTETNLKHKRCSLVSSNKHMHL